MSFLKISYGKIFLTFVLFIATLYFFFPIKANAMCEIGKDCPILNAFIKITDLNNAREYVSINFLIIGIYLIVEYILVSAIVHLSGRGGAVNFIAKK